MKKIFIKHLVYVVLLLELGDVEGKMEDNWDSKKIYK